VTKSAVLRQVVVGCLPPILTLPVDVGCLSFLRFLGEGKLSREEGKVWEGEKCECERDMVQSHTERAHSLRSVRSPFSPSHTLPSSLESFPFPKNRKMLHSAPSMKHPPASVIAPLVQYHARLVLQVRRRGAVTRRLRVRSVVDISVRITARGRPGIQQTQPCVNPQ
jgi:hypothetical protein